MLHDAGEDAGGEKQIKLIEKKFGKKVAAIVRGCTDTVENPKPEGSLLKKKYIAHLRTASKSVLLVSAYDKLHNVMSILRDYREIGEKIFDRFTAKKEGALWYYRELDRVVTELETLSR